MDVSTAAILLVFTATTALKAFSAAYFEVALSIANRLFPDGSLNAGGAEIRNQNVATFFFPKWLYSGARWANWLQYILAIPVGLKFGWLYGVAYIVLVALAIKVVMSFFSTSGLGTSMSASVMQAHLERRVQARSFRWDAGTNEEGERLFEALYRSALDLLRRVPQRT